MATAPAGPSNTIIDRIEARLARVSCVGDLNRWHREYAYGIPGTRDPRGRVHVWYRAAGADYAPAGRFARASAEEWPIDDSPVDMVFADLDIAKDKLTLHSCGPNAAGNDQPARIIR